MRNGLKKRSKVWERGRLQRITSLCTSNHHRSTPLLCSSVLALYQTFFKCSFNYYEFIFKVLFKCKYPLKYKICRLSIKHFTNYSNIKCGQLHMYIIQVVVNLYQSAPYHISYKGLHFCRLCYDVNKYVRCKIHNIIDLSESIWHKTFGVTCRCPPQQIRRKPHRIYWQTINHLF